MKFIGKNLEEFGETPELIVDYADIDDRNNCHKEKDIALDIGDYTFLQTKIVLTAGTNQFDYTGSY